MVVGIIAYMKCFSERSNSVGYALLGTECLGLINHLSSSYHKRKYQNTSVFSENLLKHVLYCDSIYGMEEKPLKAKQFYDPFKDNSLIWS